MNWGSDTKAVRRTMDMLGCEENCRAKDEVEFLCSDIEMLQEKLRWEIEKAERLAPIVHAAFKVAHARNVAVNTGCEIGRSAKFADALDELVFAVSENDRAILARKTVTESPYDWRACSKCGTHFRPWDADRMVCIECMEEE